MDKYRDDIIIYGVGDIGPDRNNPGSIFQHVSNVIQKGDISFCHLEIILSNRGVGPHAKDVAHNPNIAEAMKKAGFDVVGLAGNHNLAAGEDAIVQFEWDSTGAGGRTALIVEADVTDTALEPDELNNFAFTEFYIAATQGLCSCARWKLKVIRPKSKDLSSVLGRRAGDFLIETIHSIR